MANYEIMLRVRCRNHFETFGSFTFVDFAHLINSPIRLHPGKITKTGRLISLKQPVELIYIFKSSFTTWLQLINHYANLLFRQGGIF